LKPVYRLSLAALALCAALLAAAQPSAAQSRRYGSRLISQAEYYTGDEFRFETETPRGVRIIAVRRPNVETLRAIDRGLSDLFAIARRRGYRAALNFTDYTVFIARPDRQRDSAGTYSPDIALGAAQYRGSVYDQGGYVFAAGMVLSSDQPSFIIAEHERDFQRIANVARYEGEHIVLYHNDRALYSRTADHSRGGGHPIIQ
jgi:hypothetical protein